MLYDNEKREIKFKWIKFNHNTFIKAIFLGGGGKGACNDLVVMRVGEGSPVYGIALLIMRILKGDAADNEDYL